MPINGRTKGHQFERKLAQIFREKGYPECTTSRYSSKEQDDLKIDLCGTGDWQIQAKAVEKLSPSPHEILNSMPKGKNLLFWKKNQKGTIVCMSEELFWQLQAICDRLIKSESSSSD